MKSLLLLIFIPSLLFAQSQKVTRIIDGNSFEVASGKIVRMIGISAPDISAMFGPEAKAHLTQLISGKLVTLLPDHLSPNIDSHSNLLRYVYLNNKDMNAQVLLDGFGLTWEKYSFSNAGEYKQAEILAKSLNFGIWHNLADRSIIDTSDHSQSADLEHKPHFSFIKDQPAKAYFIGSAIFLLLFLGVYSYFRK